jgi:hypothetical protein
VAQARQCARGAERRPVYNRDHGVDLIQRMEFFAKMLRSNIFTRSALAVAFCLLYRHLNGVTGRCDPSEAKLAQETGFTIRGIKKAIAELSKSGWWRIGQGRGRGHTNSYWPQLEAAGNSECKNVNASSPIGAGKGESSFTFSKPEKVNGKVAKGELQFTRTSKNQYPYGPAIDLHRPGKRRGDLKDDANSDFERFWHIYPSRHPHPNPKMPARRKFEAAVKRGADPADILRGAQNYAAYVAGNIKDPRHIAQAQTWLNQERWNDHPEPPGPPRLRVGMN